MAEEILEQSLLEEVLSDKLEDLQTQTPGSKEAHSATEDVKILGDLHNKELEIYLNDADRTIRRDQDYEIKKAELDLKKDELAIKKKSFEHDQKVHKHSKIMDYVKTGLEAAGLIGGGVALWQGYKFEYKFNGVATGKTFNNLRSSLGKIKFRH